MIQSGRLHCADNSNKILVSRLQMFKVGLLLGDKGM